MLMKTLPDRKEQTVTAATIELLKPYKEFVLTITADNGKEFIKESKVNDFRNYF
jgi:transposase, IS30 family